MEKLKKKFGRKFKRLKKITRTRNECMLIHYQPGYTDLLSCRSPVVSSYVLKILAIGFALLELFCKRVQIIIRFWETAHLPLPYALSPNSLPVDRAFTFRGSHLSFNLLRRAGPGATPRPLSRFDRHSHASHVEL